MINDCFPISGKLYILIRDTQTGIVTERIENNLVVATGKTFIASRMASATDSVMTSMQVGTGTTAPAGADTALEATIASVSLTVAGGTPSSNTVLYTATFPAGTGTGAITEAGIFNGVMLSRTTFAVINKGAADEMIVNWIITVG